MITILVSGFLGVCALCTLTMVCAFIVGGRADEQAPHPTKIFEE